MDVEPGARVFDPGARSPPEQSVITVSVNDASDVLQNIFDIEEIGSE